MEFKAITIGKAMTMIHRGEILLPPIQRNFVWDRERILRLFDSLYRDYPVGNCIFWNVQSATSRHYPLYQFTKNFTENKKEITRTDLAPTNILNDDVFAVVDGQQRLSSLFIGLAGTYKYKKSGQGLKDVASSFVEAKLYVNLFAPEVKDQDESIFQFLGDDAAKSLTDKSLWFEVGQLLKWRQDQVKEFFDCELTDKVQAVNKKIVISKFFSKKTTILARLECLWHMLHKQKLFYFLIDKQDLDEVVDMFTRINSGGMTLKKSDLLFSVLVSQWSEGRGEIHGLVESMRDSGLDIGQDFVMRACLMLTGSPIKYNLGAFKAGNVKKIKDSWPSIKRSLTTLCDLLPQIGYIDYPNLSENALLPIAFYIMNDGIINTIPARKALQRYYVVSQVNGIFGGQSDQILERFRTEFSNQLSNNKPWTLDFDGILQMKLPGQRSMSLDIDSLNVLVDETSYGSPHAYFLLSLVYPTVDFKAHKYQVDHVHPKSKFNQSNLRNHGITDAAAIVEWEWMRNALPNLELLGKDNQYKGASSLADFLQTKNLADQREFCTMNLLPPPGDEKLILNNFDAFYDYRKKRLVSKLRPHFGL